jgi:hypothetical protein
MQVEAAHMDELQIYDGPDVALNEQLVLAANQVFDRCYSAV